MSQSSIEWTEHTWNPVVGCTKVSPGCKHCYAEIMANRLQAMGMPGYEQGFKVRELPERLGQPVGRKKPTIYFVNSMSDMFHPDVSFEFIDKVFDVIRETPMHMYQVLTKRPERMAEYFSSGRAVPDNAWLGVTVEDVEYGVPRIDVLRKIPAKVRFLSVEPLLGDLGRLDLTGIHWVLVGGESGPGARPMKEEWVDTVFQACQEQGAVFFFKQWGSWGVDGKRRGKKANGRVYRGREWDAMPAV